MTDSSSSKKNGQDQPGISGPTPKSQGTKMVKSEDSEKRILNKKLKDVEISVPIVYGNVSFWLGKKASEYQSHKWTVYVRGATNGDLGVVIKRAVFQLHSSFNNPTRVVELPPFELSEAGWGEFEISITLYFHSDVCDKPLSLYHHLKLYPEDESGPMSSKTPVVVECYDEIVFPEPSEGFLTRVQNHPAVTLPRLPSGFTLPPPVPFEDASRKKRGDTKDHPLSQWFMNFSEADELLQLAAAHQQVQAHIAKLKRQITVIDGQHQQLKAISDWNGTVPTSFRMGLHVLSSSAHFHSVITHILVWHIPARESVKDKDNSGKRFAQNQGIHKRFQLPSRRLQFEW